MKYAGITPCSIADGVGFRVVLWISGCSHYCEGCHNSYLADSNYGLDFSPVGIDTLLKYLDKPYINGLTLSGGDPLYENNRADVLHLIALIKQTLPEKSIWLYTGYEYEEICDLEHMKYIDVLVDGKFDKKCHKRDIAFRGSTNQRIIDIPKTIEKNEIVLYME